MASLGRKGLRRIPSASLLIYSLFRKHFYQPTVIKTTHTRRRSSSNGCYIADDAFHAFYLMIPSGFAKHPRLNTPDFNFRKMVVTSQMIMYSVWTCKGNSLTLCSAAFLFSFYQYICHNRVYWNLCLYLLGERHKLGANVSAACNALLTTSNITTLFSVHTRLAFTCQRDVVLGINATRHWWKSFFVRHYVIAGGS